SFVESLPQALRGALGNLHTLLRVGTPGKNFLRRLPLRPDERFLHLYRSPEDAPTELLRPDLQAELDRVPIDGFRRRLAVENLCGGDGLTLLQRMTRVDALSYLPDDVLVKVD